MLVTLPAPGGASGSVFLFGGAVEARQVVVLFADAASAGALDEAALAAAFAAHGGVPTPARARGLVRVGDGASLLGSVVRFASVAAARNALAAACSAPPVASEGSGLRAWLSALEADRMEPRALQRAVDSAMASFDETQASRSAAIMSLSARMQVDGFTLVTKGRKPRLEDEEDEFAAAGDAEGGPGEHRAGEAEAGDERRKRKRGSLAKPDFYRFQVNKEQQDSAAMRLQKFEEDRALVRRMKAARAFKPY